MEQYLIDTNTVSCLRWSYEFRPLPYQGNAPVASFDQPAKRCSNFKVLLIEQQMGEIGR